MCVGRVPGVTLILMFFGVGGRWGGLSPLAVLGFLSFFVGSGFPWLMRCGYLVLNCCLAIHWVGIPNRDVTTLPVWRYQRKKKKMSVWGVTDASSLPTHGEGTHLSSLGVSLPFSRFPGPLALSIKHAGIGGNRAPSPHLQAGCVSHNFSLDLFGWDGDLLMNFRVPLSFCWVGGGLYYY